VLHDWYDADVMRILDVCHAAMRPDAVLLVIERLLAPPNEGAEGKFSDLNMLVAAGGCERFSEQSSRENEREGDALQAIIREVVGIHFLLTRSLFGAGIPRRLFLRVSLTKLTSVALPY
jgi:hypothetical protein